MGWRACAKHWATRFSSGRATAWSPRHVPRRSPGLFSNCWHCVAPKDGVLMLAANWSVVKQATGCSPDAGRAFGGLPDAGAKEVELSLPQLESRGVSGGQAVERLLTG